MSNRQLSLVDHAYTHTSYKEQGVTNQREIILVSEKGAHWLNREASYVAASRAKQNTEIVATEVAYNKMLENAGRESGKSTAIDIGRNVSLDRVVSQERVQTQVYEPSREPSGPELGL
jgi:ATP-dependent exoDNAse (exonuclease V) alpha subunit